MEIWNDAFTDADGTTLQTHVPTGLGPGYTKVSGAINATIESNRGNLASPGGFNRVKYSLNGTLQRNVSMKMKMRYTAFTTFFNCMFVARWNTSAGAYLRAGIYRSGGSAAVFFDAHLDSNDLYEENPATLNVDTDYEVRLDIRGDHVQVFLDGVLWLDFRESLASRLTGTLGLDVSANQATVIFDDLVVETMEEKMISLRSGQWNAHREGVAEVLKDFGQVLCAGTAPTITGEIRLWTSANAPACDDSVGDYTEATFSGYAPVVIDSGDVGCDGILEFGVNEDGIGEIVIDQQAWTEGNPATITEVVNGAYLVLINGANELLLGTFLFPSPVSMAEVGDILKVNGFMLLDCQMVPVA